MAADSEDFLDELMREFTAEDPSFPALVEASMRSRKLLRALAAKRAELGLSLAEVAKRMDTTPAVVDGLERGELDPRISLIERFAVALGTKIGWCLE